MAEPLGSGMNAKAFVVAFQCGCEREITMFAYRVKPLGVVTRVTERELFEMICSPLSGPRECPHGHTRSPGITSVREATDG